MGNRGDGSSGSKTGGDATRVIPCDSPWLDGFNVV